MFLEAINLIKAQQHLNDEIILKIIHGAIYNNITYEIKVYDNYVKVYIDNTLILTLKDVHEAKKYIKALKGNYIYEINN